VFVWYGCPVNEEDAFSAGYSNGRYSWNRIILLMKTQMSRKARKGPVLALTTIVLRGVATQWQKPVCTLVSRVLLHDDDRPAPKKA